MEEQEWDNYFNLKRGGKEAGNTIGQKNKTDGKAVTEKEGNEIWKKQRKEINYFS
jgi:hypothetical protein